MSYPYFFISRENVSDNTIFITGKNYNHLVRVLRVKSGDKVEISDNEAKRYITEVAEIKKEKAILLIKKVRNITKSYPMLTLFLSILKKDAMELAIQKTAEIGIDEIVPVFSGRVVVNIDKNKIGSRISRWNEIAAGASKQCRRDFLCRVFNAVKINSLNTSLFDIFFIPVENNFFSKDCISIGEIADFFKSRKDRFKNGIRKDKYAVRSEEDKPKSKNGLKKIGYLIGPEGGFEDKELEILIKKGAVPVNFGKNILRAETASIYFLSVLDYLFKTLNIYQCY